MSHLNTAKSGFERRAFGRRETLLPAVVRINHRTIIACTVRDVSEGGALLEFSEQIELPPRIRLTIGGSVNEIICDVRHQRGHRAGVQFACGPLAIALRQVVAPADPATRVMPVIVEDCTQEHATRSQQATELVARLRKARTNLVETVAAVAVAQPEFEAPVIAANDDVPRDMSAMLISIGSRIVAQPAAGPPREMSLSLFRQT
ncbi:MAG: PilZ domain-containing protein [Hyphomicrobium sp.]|nr:PilZ domain-containing protein [Hyphomicrobium sp.]